MRRRRRRTARGIGVWLIALAAFLVCAASGAAYFLFFRDAAARKDEHYGEALLAYMACIEEGTFEEMYGMLDAPSRQLMEEEAFYTRNRNIYTGIEACNVQIEILEIQEQEQLEEGALGGRRVVYATRMDTLAGPVSFENEAVVYAHKEEGEILFRIRWGSHMIFPELGEEDKVRVKTEKGERGTIYDRNGNMLAGAGVVKAVGFVPGKMAEDPTEDIRLAAEILEVNAEYIEKQLSARWVREDWFVPIRALSAEDVERKEQVLTIPGIMVRDEQHRLYPLGPAAAHLTGYIQAISREELDERPGQHYHANSKLGKIGLESLLEERIRGIDGCLITIVDAHENLKTVIADQPAVHGETVMLTIDGALQQMLYALMQDEKGTAVVMNPYTGEVLALLSTPAYDPNEFTYGLSGRAVWQQWTEDERRPLYNRFKAAFSPGSAMKPITAAIGMDTGKVPKDENLGYHGRKWQKDNSWGNYNITTLQEYGSDVTMGNALVYSDNIYFGKAALRIGAELFAAELQRVGFGEPAPFEFGLTASGFGNELAFESEIELADSGYGQGRVLLNPLHMASLYSAFLNEGSMVAPCLEKGKQASYWKQGAFTADTARTIREYLIEIVENPNGTAHEVKTGGLTIGGKTGTAEIKASQQDETGTELGWFAGFCEENQLLFVGMIEDVKGRGGSHFVTPIGRAALRAERLPEPNDPARAQVD